MKKQTCGRRVSLAPLSHCQSTKFCEAECKEDTDAKDSKAKMVCGSDGQFYASECQMKKKNCG